MTTTYVGGMTIGAAVPGAFAIGLKAALDLEVKIQALLDFQLNITMPEINAQLTLALQLVANLQLALSLGITPPSISFQLAAILALLADLQIDLDLILAFQLAMAEAGVHVYAFDGQVDQFGAELSAELSGGLPAGSPTDHGNAIVLMTSTSAAWDAIASIFKVTP